MDIILLGITIVSLVRRARHEPGGVATDARRQEANGGASRGAVGGRRVAGAAHGVRARSRAGAASEAGAESAVVRSRRASVPGAGSAPSRSGERSGGGIAAQPALADRTGARQRTNRHARVRISRCRRSGARQRRPPEVAGVCGGDPVRRAVGRARVDDVRAARHDAGCGGSEFAARARVAHACAAEPASSRCRAWSAIPRPASRSNICRRWCSCSIAWARS